jgi:tRNA 2-thiouridine synthesizing protein E
MSEPNIQWEKQQLDPAASHGDSGFHHAPADWSPALAEQMAQEEELALGEDHWEVIRAVQEYADKNEKIRLSDLHDALEEKFHIKGGMKYLYTLFPGGPMAQGCRLAGLEPPRGSIDLSFGSVA